jgi:hypothetical protein
MRDLKGLLVAVAFVGALLLFFYGSRWAIRSVTDYFWPAFTYEQR